MKYEDGSILYEKIKISYEKKKSIKIKNKIQWLLEYPM